jgi:hypothetical protein
LCFYITGAKARLIYRRALACFHAKGTFRTSLRLVQRQILRLRTAGARTLLDSPPHHLLQSLLAGEQHAREICLAVTFQLQISYESVAPADRRAWFGYWRIGAPSAGFYLYYPSGRFLSAVFRAFIDLIRRGEDVLAIPGLVE